nr:RNA-binding, CRM domain-containing protein [Tanacetum cinerariifolium]
MKAENGGFEDTKDISTRNSKEIELHDHVLEHSEAEDESSWMNSDDDIEDDEDDDEDEDSDWENDENF